MGIDACVLLRIRDAARGDFSAFAPPPVQIEAMQVASSDGHGPRDDDGPPIDLGALLRRLDDGRG